MEFEYSYKSSSAVTSTADQTQMSFSPDTKREPTFFRGDLSKKVPFREAISALHDVVVSDLRWKPKDRTAYMEWRAKQDELDWAEIAAQRAAAKQELATLRAELVAIDRRRSSRWDRFYRAQRQYFDYLYKKDYDAWFVLDPVITVHPDEVFFECFSQDESSYGRLGCSYEVFENIGEFQCGTTNVDYSQGLYDEFQKIRSYKNTALEVDPSGFEVQTTHQESFKEVKIDLPDTWVRGFLQVSSAMSLPAEAVELHPMDVHNVCLFLRRNRELEGPRSLRWRLSSGQPVSVVIDPWGVEIECPRSMYLGDRETEIRVWGRRRIHILERLIPVARKFTMYLLGTGMPSFYVADLGDMSFTLGLSGWTSNDWSGAGNFDLLAPRAEVDDVTKRRVFEALKADWREDPDALASRLDLDRAVVLGALGAYTQAGRAIYDLNKRVYRVRELSREPLPMEQLRFSNEREESAALLFREGKVRVIKRALASGATELQGVVQHRGKAFGPTLILDQDQRIYKAECSCNFYLMNKLYKGPCEHILAVRMAASRGRGVEPGEAAAQAEAAPRGEAAPPAPDQADDTEPRGRRGMFRRVVDRITRRTRTSAGSAQLAGVALDRAMRRLVDDGLVDIMPRRRDALLEEMLDAVVHASGLESAVDLALEAMLESTIPEDVYGAEEELRAIIHDAFVSVQQAAQDD